MTRKKLTPKQLEALKKGRAKLRAMRKNKTLQGLQKGDFGTIYPQFKGKPKQAIQHLKKVKQGECPKALYRDDIGYVDIVWGENDPKTNKGYGLKHIIEKHGKEIKQLGFEVEDFIVFGFMFGKVKQTERLQRIILEGERYKLIIITKWNKKDKKLLLTAFDLRPIAQKKVLHK